MITSDARRLPIAIAAVSMTILLITLIGGVLIGLALYQARSDQLAHWIAIQLKNPLHQDQDRTSPHTSCPSPDWTHNPQSIQWTGIGVDNQVIYANYEVRRVLPMLTTSEKINLAISGSIPARIRPAIQQDFLAEIHDLLIVRQAAAC